MPCYKPLQGWMAREVNPSGKRGVVFNISKGFSDQPIEVPCGRCIGCRLLKSRQWALRCMHEASFYEENSFLTLTYNDENLPEGAKLEVEPLQKFMKRLRHHIAPKKIRFFACGEYGDNRYNDENAPTQVREKHLSQYGISALGRPHYHILLFGHDFGDKELIKDRDGIQLFMSKSLEDIWQQGYCTTGAVTFDSAAYCARYAVKKIGGDKKADHYRRIDSETGEETILKPEFVTMSRGGRGKGNENLGGVGKRWFEKYQGDVYPKDFTTFKGKKIKPPTYYDKLLEETCAETFRTIKANRVALAKAMAPDNTLDRLAEKEKVKLVQNSMLKRTIND